MTKVSLTDLFENAETQARIDDLKAQMEPLRRSPAHDRVMLDFETGAFHLRSDVEQNGMDNAAVLGQIDLAKEQPLFRFAAKQVVVEKVMAALSAPRP